MRQFVLLASVLALLALPTAQGAPPEVANADGHASSDGEVIAMVIALNEGEIRAAIEAEKKNVDPAVLDYARMLRTEHDKNLGETRELSKSLAIPPQETQDVVQMRDKAAKALANLAQLDGKAFSDAYLAAMIKDHEGALTLIDTDLSKAATQEALKKHLAATRTHIAMHLDRARSLQGMAASSKPGPG